MTGLTAPASRARRVLLVDAADAVSASLLLDPDHPDALSGGEGVVVPLPGRAPSVAKLYHPGKLDDMTVAKLRHMIAHPPQRPTRDHAWFAWPERLVVDAGHPDAVIGYTMPRVVGARSLGFVYNAERRWETGFEATYEFLLTTAHNLAAAVRAIHEAGYVIGDLNDGNALVDEDAAVTLVDLDSLQVRTPTGILPCRVGIFRYQAPDICHWLKEASAQARLGYRPAGVGLESAPRTEQSDRFALGVLIFLLLKDNEHPYQQPDFDRPWGEDEVNIRGHYPWTRPADDPGGPGTLSLPYEALAPELRELAERCFVAGHMDPTARPSAREWQAALARACDALSTCRKNRQHEYGRHLAACPWCAHAERTGGDLFPKVKDVRNQEIAGGNRQRKARRKANGARGVVHGLLRRLRTRGASGISGHTGGASSSGSSGWPRMPATLPGRRDGGTTPASPTAPFLPATGAIAALVWAWWAASHYPPFAQPVGWVALGAIPVGWYAHRRAKSGGGSSWRGLAAVWLGLATVGYWWSKDTMTRKALTQPLAEAAMAVGVPVPWARPLGISAPTRRGYVAMRHGRDREATGHFVAAVRRDTRDGHALSALGTLKLHAGAYEEAMRWFERAIRSGDPAVRARSERGMAVALYALRRFDASARFFERLDATGEATRADMGWHGCALLLAGRTKEGRALRAQAGSGPWEDCRAPLRAPRQ